MKLTIAFLQNLSGKVQARRFLVGKEPKEPQEPKVNGQMNEEGDSSFEGLQ